MVKIYIDAGHGGKDSGAVGHGLQEKNLTLTISKEIARILGDYNVNVKLSRTTDKYITLKERTDDANKWGADYFLSIHINAGGGTGYEDFIHSNLSDSSNTAKLRNTIHAEVIKAYKGIRNRGKKKANFHVLRETRMSAMLSENLFIDTKADADKLKSASFLKAVAKGHADGLIKAFNLKKKEVKKAPTTSGETFYRVVAGSYKSRKNADAQVDKLKKLGISGVFIDVFKK